MMPEPHKAPDLISTGVQATVDTSSRLGLTWKLRIGTVAEFVSVNRVTVRLDGDESSLTMVSMIGNLAPGIRVYVLTIPPAGNYVTGTASVPLPGTRIATTVRVANSSGFTTTETVTDSVTATLIGGLTYKVTAQLLGQSTVANDAENVRIREDTLVGAQVAVSRVLLSAAGAGHFVHLEYEYTPTVSEAKTFVLTGVRAVGTGTIIHAAGTNAPTYFYVDFARVP